MGVRKEIVTDDGEAKTRRRKRTATSRRRRLVKMLGLAEEHALEQDALGFGEGTWAEQARGPSWLGLRRRGRLQRKEFPSKEEREDPKEREDIVKRRK